MTYSYSELAAEVDLFTALLECGDPFDADELLRLLRELLAYSTAGISATRDGRADRVGLVAIWAAAMFDTDASIALGCETRDAGVMLYASLPMGVMIQPRPKAVEDFVDFDLVALPNICVTTIEQLFFWNDSRTNVAARQLCMGRGRQLLDRAYRTSALRVAKADA